MPRAYPQHDPRESTNPPLHLAKNTHGNGGGIAPGMTPRAPHSFHAIENDGLIIYASLKEFMGATANPCLHESGQTRFLVVINRGAQARRMKQTQPAPAPAARQGETA